MYPVSFPCGSLHDIYFEIRYLRIIYSGMEPQIVLLQQKVVDLHFMLMTWCINCDSIECGPPL